MLDILIMPQYSQHPAAAGQADTPIWGPGRYLFIYLKGQSSNMEEGIKLFSIRRVYCAVHCFMGDLCIFLGLNVQFTFEGTRTSLIKPGGVVN